MEWHHPGDVNHRRPDRADNLKPGRKLHKMFSDEACQCISIVWPVLLSLTETIHHNDAHAGGYLAGAGESVQWLQDTGDQGLAGAGIAAGKRQSGLDGLVRL